MLLEQFINGITQGSIYALIALGFTIIFGTLRLVTFAHGEVFMMGALMGFTAMRFLHGSILFALIVAILSSGLLGIVIERVGFHFLRKAPHQSSLLITIGFSILLINLAQMIWGPETQSIRDLKYGDFQLFGIYISYTQVIVLAVTFILLAITQILIYKTKIGRTIRATAQDYEAAYAMGVNVDLVFMFTFSLGSLLGGIAGMLIGFYYNAFYPTMGTLPGLKAFSACILGGLTSLGGSVIAGFILGVVENLAVAYISSSFRDVFAFGILIFVLIFRPRGLFGKEI
ncbi:MAG: branched-chain amino acid ABC transporter permease [Thermodesulfobacteriota bacterium]